ncbi:MAG: rhomboid family intramembrane serine protease [Desulfonatronovibrionaceae bacterium]
MIPIQDSIPNVHKPVMVRAILVVNAFVFLYILVLDDYAAARLFHVFGAVPARFTHPDWAQWMGYPKDGFYSLLTYMFIHGGWLHFLGNMLSLWIFADNIEDIMGPVKFLVFYCLCGLGALGIHILFNPNSAVPVVGASGAIAGVMGAYFLLYPHSKVVAVIPVIFIPLFLELPAVVFLGLWFVMQFFSGITSQVGLDSGTGGAVAWWAHVGGFVLGMLILRFFRDEERCYYCYQAGKKKRWDDFF